MTNQEKKSGRSEIYDFDDCDFGSGDFVFFGSEIDDGLSTEQSSRADDWGDIEVSREMVDFHNKTDLKRSSIPTEEPNTISQKGVPFAYTSFTEEKKITTKLEDFGDTEEQWAAYAIFQAVHSILKLDIKAFSWVFSSDFSPIMFEQCCHALYSRPDVVRLRILFELWRIGAEGFNTRHINIVEPPPLLQKWAFSQASFSGITTLQAIWENPGITMQNLTKKGINRVTIDTLLSEYIVSKTESGSFYVTGVNPIMKQYEDGMGRFVRNNRSWSSLFPK